MSMIECTNLSNNSLKSLDFFFEEGRVLGLLGKNGAGKTTLLSVLMGVLEKNPYADVKVLGHEPGCWPEPLKSQIGYVPQRFWGFDALSIRESINTIKPFYQHWDDALATELINEFDLPEHQQIKTLSEGQKQLTSIVLAMSFRPKLLVLDEPVASLDPLSRRQFLEKLIENHCDHGTSVIFSTHITSDLERIASDVLILKDGKALITGDIESVRESVVRVKFNFPENKKLTFDGLSVLSSGHHREQYQLLVDQGGQNIKQLLADKGATNIQIEHINLDDLFLELHS